MTQAYLRGTEHLSSTCRVYATEITKKSAWPLMITQPFNLLTLAKICPEVFNLNNALPT